MIDFRYHLVSIVAIFLALAIGIVLGAGPLKGTSTSTLTSRSTSSARRTSSCATQIVDLPRQNEFSAGDTSSTEIAAGCWPARSAAQTVVLVALPGADDATARRP